MIARHLDLERFIMSLENDQRDAALAALDHISRPLTVAEIRRALHLNGIPRTRAAKIAEAVKGLAIIAITGGE